MVVVSTLLWVEFGNVGYDFVVHFKNVLYVRTLVITGYGSVNRVVAFGWHIVGSGCCRAFRRACIAYCILNKGRFWSYPYFILLNLLTLSSNFFYFASVSDHQSTLGTSI